MLREEVEFNVMEDEIEEAITCNYDQRIVLFLVLHDRLRG
jgi:hypothetical protein